MSINMRPNKLFTLRITASVGAILFICILLVGLTYTQGPRLRRIEVNKNLITKQANERATLYANMPLSPVRKQQVTISPHANYSIKNLGDTIIIQFTERLRYDTTYKITLNEVSGVQQDSKKVTLTSSFRTSSPTLYYLRRNQGAEGQNSQQYIAKEPDQIIRSDLSDSESTEVFATDKIQQFTICGNSLIVASVNDDNTNSLYITDLDTHNSRPLALPVAGNISKLQSSPDGSQFGFIFTSNEAEYTKRAYDSNLFTVNLNNDYRASPVHGLDDKPLRAMDWSYAPDGSTILAQTLDSNAIFIDTHKKYRPVPLGQFTRIGNFAADGSQISAQIDITHVLFDTVSRSTSPIRLRAIGGKEPNPTIVSLLSNGDGYLYHTRTYANHNYNTPKNYFVLHTKTRDDIVYQTDASDIDINGYTISPNDQFLAVEQNVIHDSSNNIAYPDNSKPSSTYTQLVDMATGQPTRKINGFDIIWK